MSLCPTSHQEPINLQVIDKLPGQIPFHPLSFGQVKVHSTNVRSLTNCQVTSHSMNFRSLSSAQVKVHSMHLRHPLGFNQVKLHSINLRVLGSSQVKFHSINFRFLVPSVLSIFKAKTLFELHNSQRENSTPLPPLPRSL